MKFKLTSQIESDKEQKKIRDMGLELFKKRPMTDEELLVNPGLFIRSGVLAKLLFLNEIYSCFYLKYSSEFVWWTSSPGRIIKIVLINYIYMLVLLRFLA